MGILSKLRLDAKQFQAELGGAIKSQGNFDKASRKSTAALKEQKAATDKASGSVGGLVKSIAGIAAGVLAFSALKNAITSSIEASADALAIETKFRTMFLTTKGATEEQIQSILAMNAALQKKGVIEDDALTAGAAMLSSYKLQGSTIAKLLPSVANMVAAQKGYKGTSEDVSGTAQLLGRAMMGHVAMLARAGVVLTEQQKAIFKYGNEQQRVAALSKVLESRFGGVNEALGKTDAGRAVQVANMIGDAQETLGAKFEATKTKILSSVAGALPMALDAAMKTTDGVIAALTNFVGFVKAEVVPALKGIGNEIQRVANLFPAMNMGADDFGMILRGSIVAALGTVQWGLAWIADHGTLIKSVLFGVAAGYTAVAVATAAQAYVSGAATAATWSLNAAIAANPVGALALAIGAAVAAITYLGLKVWENRAKIKAAFEAVGEYARGLWTKFRAWIQPAVDLLGSLARGAMAIGKAFGMSDAHFVGLQNTLNRHGQGGQQANNTAPATTNENFAADTLTGTTDGSHATGLFRVPRNNYIAELHRGERVLTRGEAASADRGGKSISVAVTINGVGKTTDEILSEFVPRLKLAIKNSVG